MDRERRDFIAAATMAGAVTGMGASAAPGTGVVGQSPTTLPDIGFATREPFLDRERARRILTEEWDDRPKP